MFIGRIFGTILRALSVIWFISAIARIFLGLVGEGPSSNIWVGLFSVVLSVATFKFGTWLKSPAKTQPEDVVAKPELDTKKSVSP